MENSDILFLKDLTVGVLDLHSLQVSFIDFVNSGDPIFTEHIVVPFDFYFHGSSDEDEHFLIIPDSKVDPDHYLQRSVNIYFHDQLIEVAPGVEQLFIFSFEDGPLNSYVATSLTPEEEEIVQHGFTAKYTIHPE